MPFWRTIDWRRPWLAPYRECGERVCRLLDQGASVAQALNAQAAQRWPMLAAGALRFVAQHELPDGEAYEAFIARRACVPTRDNLHDLFNGLVWLAFPAWKRRLNELQAEQIARVGIGQTRGSVRDALTLFDENAALWQAPDCLVGALRARDWTALFITRRAAWQDARLTLFGHALLDKLTQPRKAITAHLWTLRSPDELTAHCLASKAHLPLPVLGVPGWWRDNESPGFYADAEVFRPHR
ncbi:DUF3025 domain-containing protein [Piscinibacter sp.]|jgi:hypothetical protein|uniref:DUF3025 domain-containing protein n=1 Tax=Piscinibacter sp. TaxID=1903157 RepID=UPI002F3F1F6C